MSDIIEGAFFSKCNKYIALLKQLKKDKADKINKKLGIHLNLLRNYGEHSFVEDLKLEVDNLEDLNILISDAKKAL